MRFGRVDWPPPVEHRAQIRLFLAPAIEGTETDTISGVEEQIASGAAQLWAACDDEVRMALVTRFREGRDGLALEYWLLGGEGHQAWFDMMVETIEAAARACGCAKIVGEGRPAWVRLFKGYRQVAVCMEKRL